MPILINFLQTYWKQLAIAGLAAFLFLFGYYKGYEHEKAKYDAHLADDARVVAIAKAQNDYKVKQAQAITENITKEYSNAVSKINDYYKSHPHIVKLCNNPVSGSSLSAESQSAGGTYSTAQGTTQTTSEELDLQIIAKEVAQCQALIEWEKQQDRAQ